MVPGLYQESWLCLLQGEKHGFYQSHRQTQHGLKRLKDSESSYEMF